MDIIKLLNYRSSLTPAHRQVCTYAAIADERSPIIETLW
jgi:hypothetical protein